MKKVLLAVTALCVMLPLFACSLTKTPDTSLNSDSSDFSDSSVPQPDSNSSDPQSSSDSSEPTDEITLGSTFAFNDLEITVGTEIGWDVIKNQFANENGRDVIVVPLTVTNLSDETNMLNIFSISEYSPSGQELEQIGTYFENDVFSMGKLRPGATGKTNLHILYDSDGDYYLEFGLFLGKAIEVKIPVKK